MDALKALKPTTEETLDPDDWSEVQALSHQIVDDAVGYLRDVRDRPVWRDMPAEVKAFFTSPLPRLPAPLSEIYRELAENRDGLSDGQCSSALLGLVHGVQQFYRRLGRFSGGHPRFEPWRRQPCRSLVDQQMVSWCKEMVGFPASASGTLVSGGSMANIIGLNVARNVKAGVDVREHGVAAIEKPLRFYGSEQLHSCHRKAMEAWGWETGRFGGFRQMPSCGSTSLPCIWQSRKIAPPDFKPACVIGTAGTVNTGAIDDLQALAEPGGARRSVVSCRRLHRRADRNRSFENAFAWPESSAPIPWRSIHISGFMRRSRSGCALVRDASAHRSTFAVTPEYLEMTTRGLASANWLHDYGLQTSRGFRALKVWMALKEHGIEKFGRLIDQNIEQGHYLSSLIENEPLLELVAPTNINIVCYRYHPCGIDGEGLKALNTEIMLRLQEEGTAALSDTTVHGEHCLRAAINNHRTRRGDLELLVRENNSPRRGDCEHKQGSLTSMPVPPRKAIVPKARANFLGIAWLIIETMPVERAGRSR